MLALPNLGFYEYDLGLRPKIKAFGNKHRVKMQTGDPWFGDREMSLSPCSREADPWEQAA